MVNLKLNPDSFHKVRDNSQGYTASAVTSDDDKAMKNTIILPKNLCSF